MADDIIYYEGTVLPNSIVPGSSIDKFATHQARFGQGGWRSVNTIADRDAITDPRLEVGMSVYVTSEKKLYILSALDTSTNPYTKTWTLFSAGGVVVMPTPSATEVNNIVQYIGATTQDYTQGYFYKCVSDGQDPATYSWEQIDVQPSTPLIWGNITGTLSDQTDLNTELTGLQTQIDALKSRGRYLSTWNANTGLPTTNPTELPYELKAGDYYIVGQLADEEHLEIEQAVGSSLSDLSVDFDTFVTAVDPDEDVDTEYTFLYSVDTWSLDGTDINDISEYGITFEGTPVDTDEIKVTYICAKTNKRPDVVWENNKPYYTGTASTVVETAELSLNDSYIFDGTQWVLLANADSKVNDVRLNGVSVVTDKIANLDLVAADSSYHNDAVGTITNVQQALDTLMNIHYYQAPKGTFTVSNLGETTREIGTVIEQPFTLSWNLTNRTLEAVDVCYYKLPGDSTQYTVSAVPGSYIYTTNLTSNTRNDSKTFSFYYKDNHTTKPSASSTDTYTGSATVTFRAKMYYGVSTKSSLTDAEIRALSSEWCINQDSITTSKQGSTTVQYRNFGPFTDANNDFYVYLVFPTADCINGHGIKFTEGFETNDYQLTQRNVESATGLTNVQYNIYRFHANNAYPSGSTTSIKIEKM